MNKILATIVLSLLLSGNVFAEKFPEEFKIKQLGLGMKKIFGSESNPLPWLDYMLNGVEHTNFFENRATEYSRASTTGNWQDIFK